MRTSRAESADLKGVFAVPPLCRHPKGNLTFTENSRVVAHLRNNGITRVIYGGNAFLYHITLADYADLLCWMVQQADDLWMIPSAGPSYGRLMDQAPLLKRHSFPAVMQLPCGDPRDAAGIEAGLRDFVHAAATPLIVYIKTERDFGADLEAGLDAIARLAHDGFCIGIKYAVVRPDPADDPYLESLLKRVDPTLIVSGMGERPAVTHLKHFRLSGFTTGSGCLAPTLSNRILAAAEHDIEEAEQLRNLFLPLEDLRDEWGPARVLHAATRLAGIAETGPIPPFITALNQTELAQLKPVSLELYENNVALNV